MLPCIRLQVKSVDLIVAIAFGEASEYDHGVVMYNGCMLIKRRNFAFVLVLLCFHFIPLESAEVEREDLAVAGIVVTATVEVHEVVIYNTCMVR